MSKKLSFPEVVAQLNRLGLPYSQKTDYGKKGTEERHEFDVPFLWGVTLIMTFQEWFETCTRDGEHYIGPCCGTTGRAQDIIQEVFREGGFFSAEDLTRLGHTLSHHDERPSAEFCFTREPSRDALLDLSPTGYQDLDPWTKMAFLWHLTRDYLLLSVPQEKGAREPLREAFTQVRTTCDIISWEMLFDRSLSETEASRAKLLRSLTMANLIPHLKVMLAAFEEIPFKEVPCFALCHKDSKEVAEMVSGPAIWETAKEAKRTLDIWVEAEKEGEENIPDREEKPILERFGIFHVIVNPREGVKVLDEVV